MTLFEESPDLETVGDLMSALSIFDPALPVRSVDEGLIRKVRVYAGTAELDNEPLKRFFVALDGDGGIMQDRFQEDLRA